MFIANTQRKTISASLPWTERERAHRVQSRPAVNMLSAAQRCVPREDMESVKMSLNRYSFSETNLK